MELRKPKFVGKQTKWEKRRIARRFARRAIGKKPLVEPLTIASRQAALKEGKLIFYNGNKRIELSMADRQKGNLQGIFKDAAGTVITLRSVVDEICGRKKIIFHTVVQNNTERLIKNAFAFRDPFGQLYIPEEFRGIGLGLKTSSMVEREGRVKGGGKGIVYSDCDTIQALYEKLHYSRDYAAKELSHEMHKNGKFRPKDDLDRFHRIEAIDPKTGKARIFTFPIKKTSGK